MTIEIAYSFLLTVHCSVNIEIVRNKHFVSSNDKCYTLCKNYNLDFRKSDIVLTSTEPLKSIDRIASHLFVSYQKMLGSPG